MRLIRSAGQNVSPSDDGRLYDQIFADGLFEDATFANLGQNNVAVSEIYGIICGRDFTCEAQTIQVTLPEEESTVTGYIYLEVNTAAENVFTINSALAPFTPTYEDINTNGVIAQMVLARYTATQLAVQSVTATYTKVNAGTVKARGIATYEESPALANHAVGEFILWNGQFYKVRSAISAGEELAIGTNINTTSIGVQLKVTNDNLASLMVYKAYTYNYTLGANGYVSLTAANFNMTGVDGYTIAAVRAYQTGNANVFTYGVNPGNSSGVMRLRNISDSSISATATIGILYVKSDMINVIQ